MLQQDIVTRWNSTFLMMESHELSVDGAELELPTSLSACQWGLANLLCSDYNNGIMYVQITA